MDVRLVHCNQQDDGNAQNGNPDQFPFGDGFLEKQGRGLPDGLLFIDSWLTADNSCVYQLMQTDTEALLFEWMEFWSDLVSFEHVELREKPGNG